MEGQGIGGIRDRRGVKEKNKIKGGASAEQSRAEHVGKHILRTFVRVHRLFVRSGRRAKGHSLVSKGSK